MKHDAYLVNTARGEVVNPDAVVLALSGPPAGYAGDVWFPQPALRDHPWRAMPREGMTPHISGASLSVQGGGLAGAGAHAYSAGDATGGLEDAARFNQAGPRQACRSRRLPPAG